MYPYPPLATPGDSARPPDPGRYEPRSFADVLMEELDVIGRRREVVFARSRGTLNRATMAAERVNDPATLLDDARDQFQSNRRKEQKPDDEDSYLTYARLKALGLNVAGLAFSGGGIRSATFAVGFLQGLAGLKLLRFFDVLSTVSGGGYAGGWLATWMRREGDPVNVEYQLDPSRIGQKSATRGPRLTEAGDGLVGLIEQVVDEEPEPVCHLRRYSSYLNPRPGMLSADTWTVVAIYFRNVLINLLVLLPVVLTLVLVVRLLFWSYGWVSLNGHPWVFVTLFAVGVGASLVALVVNIFALSHLHPDPGKGHGTSGRIVFLFEVSPLLLAAVTMSMTYQPILDSVRGPVAGWLSGWNPSQAHYLGWPNVLGHATLFAVLALAPAVFCYIVKGVIAAWKAVRKGVIAAWKAVRGVGPAEGRLDGDAGHPVDQQHHGGRDGREQADQEDRRGRSKWWRWSWDWFFVLIASAGAGATMGVLVTLTEEVLRPAVVGHSAAGLPLDPHSNVRPVLRPAVVGHSAAVLSLIGPPLLLVDLVVAVAALIALSGVEATEPEREWWAWIAALLLMTAGGWVVFIGVVLLGPLIFLGNHQLVAAALASGWVGVTAAGVRAGRSAGTSTGGGGRGQELLAMAAPPVFLIGLLAAVSTAVVLLVDRVARVAVQPSFGRAAAAYLYAIQRVQVFHILYLLIPSVIMMVLGLFLVNVNLFSLHAMYANRLTRAFLGASRRRADWADRWEQKQKPPWPEPARDQRVLAGAPTGVLQGGQRNPNPVTQFDPADDLDLVELAVGAGDDTARYWGPLVIFNTALNLVGGQKLAWRDRKAESFALTPIFCGAKRLPRNCVCRLLRLAFGVI
ncbi:MAG: patatin-like phospholipase family protein [Planctomycetaceae bacterium]|nr:patatin-like phospholipase family protein [Planctomycetaceae bacterium]